MVFEVSIYISYLFGSVLQIPVKKNQVMLGCFLFLTRTKQRKWCLTLAQGHNTVPLVGIKPVTPGSQNTFQSLWVPTTYIVVEKLEKLQSELSVLSLHG